MTLTILQDKLNKVYYSNEGQITRMLSTIKLDEKVKLVFIEQSRTIQAYCIKENGCEILIKAENTPREIRSIDSSLLFQKLLSRDIYASTHRLSNGDLTFDIKQRIRGGAFDSNDNSSNTDQNLAIETMRLVKAGRKNIAENNVKENIIMLVGRTNAGKSLLANHLSGVSILGIKGSNEDFKFEALSPSLTVSHSNIESCTKYPGIYCADKQTSYVDCAGFGDTREAFQDIANAFFRSEITKNATNLKILLVVEYIDIYYRSVNLNNTFSDLIQFLGYCEGKSEEELKKIANSIALVVTKAVQPKKTAEQLQSKIDKLENKLKQLQDQPTALKKRQKIEERLTKRKEKLEELTSKPSVMKRVKGLLTDFLSETSPLTKQAKIILRELIETNHWTLFSAPQKKGASTLAEKERDQIKDLILTRTNYMKKEDAKIQIKVSPGYSGRIQTSLLSILEDLKDNYRQKVLNDFENYFMNLFQKKMDITSIQTLQKQLQTLLNLKEFYTLKDFLAAAELLKQALGDPTIKEFERYEEMMEFLVELLPSNAKKNFPLQRNNWLDVLDIKTKLTEWNEFLLKMVSEPQVIFNKGILLLQGYFLKTSQIQTMIKNYNNIAEVRLYALDTVTIDADLTENLNNVKFTIIAPHWEIQSDKVINISGQHSSHTYQSPAANGSTWSANGEDGSPGLPGNNGGYLFGLGDSFSGLEKLTIIANGGNGGTGQRGGEGHPGNTGADADVQRTPSHREGGYWSGYVHQTDGNSNQLHANYGKAGGNGGDGGKGGAGGLGGHEGTIELISILTKNLTFNASTKKGNPGNPGSAGSGAEGGANGRDWLGSWYHNDDKWNDLHSPHHKATAFARKSHNGSSPDKKNDKKQKKPDAKTSLDINAQLVNFARLVVKENNPFLAPSLKTFLQKIQCNDSIKNKANLASFIAECSSLEDLFKEVDALSLPLHQSVLDRMTAYAEKLTDPKELVLLQSLCSLILSKICQHQFDNDSRLVIDIKGFLKGVGNMIEELRSLDKERMIRSYETEYESQIKSKISEADIFIKKLSQDIREADKELTEQIKNLLHEVEECVKQGAAAKQDLIAKREKLKEIKKKKVIFGVISIVVQGAGCFFPPTGPIIAGIVNAGLNIIKDSTTAMNQIGIIADHAQNLESLLRHPPATPTDIVHQTTLTRLKNIANTAKPLVESGLNLMRENNSDDDKIKEVEAAIASIDAQKQQLEQYTDMVSKSFNSSLHDFVQKASELQKQLQQKSKISLDFSRLEIKRAFENVKRMVAEMTEGFATGDHFINIIRQLEEALETSLSIYMHVQDFQERLELVHFMANIAAPASGTQDPRVEAFKLKTKRHMILEQYCKAISTVKQWAFPFGSLFLKDFSDLQQFEKIASEEDLMIQISNKLKSLQAKIDNYYHEVQSRIDKALWREEFSNKSAVAPFYTWNNHEFKSTISQLFKGEKTLLYADVNHAPLTQSAIKFQSIEIQIKCNDDVLQKRLEQELSRFKVKMHHSGHSYYRYQNQVYHIANEGEFCLGYSFEKNTEGSPISTNEVYRKMKEGDLLLSPYTSWIIEIEPVQGDNDLYKKFEKELSKFKICLVGKGQYVDEAMTRGRLNLDIYQDSILKKVSH